MAIPVAMPPFCIPTSTLTVRLSISLSRKARRPAPTGWPARPGSGRDSPGRAGSTIMRRHGD
jgi:hypothetical protein